MSGGLLTKNILTNGKNEMEQTPVHDNHNPDLLRLIPKTSKCIVEVGCSSGALAREFKKINQETQYIGIEIDDGYVNLAKRYCDEVHLANIENMSDVLYQQLSKADCWVFGDTLEHLQNPWNVLNKIRSFMPKNGVLAACIPNAQHWSLQVKLNIGEFRYEDSGLLDKTHLRWFTRKTLIELFHDTGFDILKMHPRIFNEPGRDEYLSLLQRIAKRARANSDEAVNDAIPLQYCLLVKPKL